MRAALRLAAALALLGAATIVLVPWNWLAGKLRLPGRVASAKAWNRTALFALGWRVRLEGTPAPSRPLLIAANHVSWADVVVFAAYLDAAFIAKSEVSGWPLFGLLARLHDAIFIEREQKRATREQAQAIAARLKRGKALVLFPEGTTADGNHLLPFKSSLFGAVELAGPEVTVQPVAIAYTRLYGLPLGHAERRIAAWMGEATLAEHLVLLFRHGPLDVTLRFGEPLSRSGLERKEIARASESRVREMLAQVRSRTDPESGWNRKMLPAAHVPSVRRAKGTAAMTLARRMEAGGLDRVTAGLLLLSIPLALLHHADHVLRVDHSGWPFRAVVTPFTFSLLAYPMILFALFGPKRLFCLRLGLLALGTAFTLFAHTAIESPQMQFGMWAENRSLDPHAAGLHNLLDIRSGTLGVASVVVGMALNVTALAATLAMLRRYLALRRSRAGLAEPE